MCYRHPARIPELFICIHMHIQCSCQSKNFDDFFEFWRCYQNLEISPKFEDKHQNLELSPKFEDKHQNLAQHQKTGAFEIQGSVAGDGTCSAWHAGPAGPAAPWAPCGLVRPPAPPLPQERRQDTAHGTAAPPEAAPTLPSHDVPTGTSQDAQASEARPPGAPAARTAASTPAPGRGPEDWNAQQGAAQAARAAMTRGQGPIQAPPTPSAGRPPQGTTRPAAPRPRERAGAGCPNGAGPRGPAPHSGPRPGAGPPSGSSGGQHTNGPSDGFDGLDPTGWPIARCTRIPDEGRYAIPPQWRPA